ncbi:hypothetical protein CASFOL_033827 [Castilleja foliolosa]|uniref:Uncharacterized protein n=1 Tax=Castilleja foliolosa TaxID=1961234 RepID=A0ABD3BY44_9LAMI
MLIVLGTIYVNVETMLQLGLGGGAGPESYPERPDERDCSINSELDFLGMAIGAGSIIPVTLARCLLG